MTEKQFEKLASWLKTQHALLKNSVVIVLQEKPDDSSDMRAWHIDKFLGGSGKLVPDAGLTFSRPSDEELMANTVRVTQECVSVERRKTNFDEVVLGLDKSKAECEAKRCLRCDLGE